MGIIVSAVVGMLATFWVITRFISALQAIVNFADTVLSWGDSPVSV
jgi:hypothetical protein